MFLNYFSVAARNIQKNKASTFVNIAGLATGLTTFALIMLWVHDEMNFDRFNVHFSNLYRIVENQHYAGGEIFPVAVTPAALSQRIKEEYPEVIQSTRLTERNYIVRAGDKIYSEEFTLVDPDFLTMFSLEMIQGDKASALTEPQSVILTVDLAGKYFGTEDPMGKTLSIDGQSFIVTGVMKNFPGKAHFQVKSLLPFPFLKSKGTDLEDWSNNSYWTYLLMDPKTDIEAFNTKIKDLIKRNNKGSTTDIYLQPIGEIHLYSSGRFTAEIGAQGDIKYVRALSLVAVFILLIACINFMNLSTAQSSKRAREAGMRKVVGASRGKLILQFLGESVVMVLIAYTMSVLFIEILLPWFGNLTGKTLRINYFTADYASYTVAVVLITGIIAGSYPAFYISSFNPLKVLKGALKTGPGASIFRKALVTVQFTISISLIIVTLVVSRQMNYIQQRKLGYDRENLVYFDIGQEIKSHLNSFRQDLLSNPDIISVTTTNQVPTYIGNSTSGWTWEGKSSTEEVLMHMVTVDEDYLKTFRIGMEEGRFYSREMMNDTSYVVLNKTAAAMVGGDSSVIGRFLSIGPYRLSIIGVVKDFHFKSVHRRIEPLVLAFLPHDNFLMFARIAPENKERTLKFIETTFKKYAGDQPYSSRFLDDDFNNLYRAEQRMSKIFRYFALLAILISCLGLFGLSLFTAEQKTKEIGIRKTMGASNVSLVLLFLKDYFRWVALATLISFPVSWYAMQLWLENFAYRIHLRPLEFIVAAVLAFNIAMITVSYQALRSALGNPVNSLKYE